MRSSRIGAGTGLANSHRGAPQLFKVKRATGGSNIAGLAGLIMALAMPLVGCSADIDRHGHVFIDVDVNQIKPGMSKDQVKLALGSPDTTGTISGDAYYYISTTQKSYAFFKPWEIDRQVVAVYFNRGGTVDDVAHYGLKDGIVVNYAKDETPARGKDLTVLEQLFGNIAQRRLFKGQQQSVPGLPP